MKNEQQQQAKNLYFQTNLNKTQIAETLGINRRTVMLWVQQGNWDRLKLSSQHLPSMVVEKCYYMLNHYLDNLLSANSVISTFGPKEASAINQLATGIKKISNRSAVNESMELLSFFLEDVRRKDPAMAEAIMPFAEQYIATRKDVNLTDFLPQGFNEEGFLNIPEDEIEEQWLDEEEQQKIDEDFVAWKAKKTEAKTSEQAPVTQVHITSGPVSANSERSPNEPRHSSISDIFSQKESLPKSIEKQLTNYLKKQNLKVA